MKRKWAKKLNNINNQQSTITCRVKHLAQAAGRERVALIEVFNRVALVPGELGWTGSVCKHDMKCCHCQLLTRLQQEFACSSTYSNQPCHMVRPRLSRTPHRSRATGQLCYSFGMPRVKAGKGCNLWRAAATAHVIARNAVAAAATLPASEESPTPELNGSNGSQSVPVTRFSIFQNYENSRAQNETYKIYTGRKKK